MEKIILITLFIFILGAPCFLYAQESQFHPYIGASLNLIGYPDEQNSLVESGLGFEVGIRHTLFYGGIEYGVYGFIIISQTSTSGSPPTRKTSDELRNHEQYYGFHIGCIINRWLSAGVVFLWSATTVTHVHYDILASPPIDTSYQYQRTLFNVGPDIRLMTSEHVTLDFAYTIRRGLKVGFAFIF